MLEKELEKMLTDGGACLVGFCELNESPIKDESKLKYAISIAYKLSDVVLRTIKERPTISYFQHYRAVNAYIDRLELDVIRFLENHGYDGFPIPASQSTSDDKSLYRGLYQHKTVARLSGIGFIGKSGLLLTKEYGSKVRFGTVLTDMPLTSQREIINGGCGDCEICKNACPAGAISGINYSVGLNREDFFDAEKCSKNMKTYNDVGRGAVCGICIKVCPYNKLK